MTSGLSRQNVTMSRHPMTPVTSPHGVTEMAWDEVRAELGDKGLKALYERTGGKCTLEAAQAEVAALRAESVNERLATVQQLIQENNLTNDLAPSPVLERATGGVLRGLKPFKPKPAPAHELQICKEFHGK